MKTRNIFAGMTAIAMALSFAACGAAENTDDAQTELAAVAAPTQTAEKTETKETAAPAAETKETTEDKAPGTDVPAEIKALIDALKAEDFDAYVTACGTKEDYRELMIALGISEDGEYSDEDLKEEWESCVKSEYDFAVLGMKSVGDDYTVTTGELSDEERAEFEVDEDFPGDMNNVKVYVSDGAGNKAEFICEEMTVKSGGTIRMLEIVNSSDDSAKDSAAQLTNAANAKTLYNAAAEAYYNAKESGSPVADGVYEYDTDGEYDDPLGKNIVEIFSVAPEYHAHCTITIADGEVKLVEFDPQDGSAVGTYPEAE